MFFFVQRNSPKTNKERKKERERGKERERKIQKLTFEFFFPIEIQCFFQTNQIEILNSLNIKYKRKSQREKGRREKKRERVERKRQRQKNRN